LRRFVTAGKCRWEILISKQPPEKPNKPPLILWRTKTAAKMFCFF
jgi:hypothetical protein